jgi:hypothetical protein
MSEENKAYNASDEEQVKGRQKDKKKRALIIRIALKRLMSSPDGRAWMWDILSSCGAFRSSFDRDPIMMAFNEGRQDVGHELIGQIHSLDGGPELYMRMTLENQPQVAADTGRDEPNG